MLSRLELEPLESNLVPHDFDVALLRMKTDLALLDLRRELLRENLDARSVLALTDRILALQAARPQRTARPRWRTLASL
jgi:hypothetical protein